MRRLALRRLQTDDGLTLLETVVALLVFSLIMTALAGSMALIAKSASVNKVRNVAVSLGQKLLEEGRAKGVSNLTLCPGAPTSITYNGQPNQQMAVALTTTPTCLPYQQTKSIGNYTYTITTLVVFGKSGTTIGGQPLAEKYLDVTLAWTAPKPGSYNVSTVVNNNTTVPNAIATGLQFDMQDAAGNKLGTAAVTWHYKVCASNVSPCDGNQTNVVAEGDTQENGQPLVEVPAGTYTCFLDNTNAQGWVPDTSKNPGTYTLDNTNGTISGPCQVTNNQVFDWLTYWQPIGTCSYSSSTKGGLNVFVVDQFGNPVKNANVTINAVTGTTTATKAAGSGSSTAGYYAAFTGLPDDYYYYSVALTGYNTVTNLGPACVAGTKTTTATASIATSTGCATTGATGNVTVTVTDATGVNPIGGAVVGLFNISTGAWVSVGTTSTKTGTGYGAITKTGVPSGAYYLFASDSATTGSAVNGVTQYKYDGSGGMGPYCVQDTTAAPNGNPFTAALQAYQTNSCPDTSSKGTLNVTVMDGAGKTLSNVPVQFINIDQIAAPAPGTPVKTGANGVANLGSQGYDPYFIIANSPNGTQLSGYFMTPGATCLNATSINYTINLNGYMNVKVMIDNQSTPLKTYNIVIVDPHTNPATTTKQSLTVVGDPTTGNPPQIQAGANQVAATFSQLPTDTGYQLTVYQATDTGDNGDVVCGMQSYDWTAVTTYTPPTCTDYKS